MPTPDFISRAARFWVLAEQASRLHHSSNKCFWELSVPLALETAIHLPALTAAARRRNSLNTLENVVSHALPAVLPPEAVPWHNQLVTAWEGHRTSIYLSRQNLARRALVRLDGCGMSDGRLRPSRLPEWLAEAQKIASGEWRMANGCNPYQELEALAALAAWRPAPQVIIRSETLREWRHFWLRRRQSKDPVEKGIAAIALLNLPEAGLRAASIPLAPTKQLLRQLATAIQVAAERPTSDALSLLDWQPVKGPTWPVAEVRNVARSWLEVTGHAEPICRFAAWQELVRWDRAGSLDICGIDLLPELVQAVRTEKNEHLLWEMAQWSPGTEHFVATGTRDSLSQLRQLEEAWKQHRASRHAWERASAWLARIRLHQAGPTSESPGDFFDAWLSALATERHSLVLFTLAQWSPGADAPGRWHRDWHDGWQQRLLDEDESIQQVAAWALLRQSLEKEPDRSLRGAALELWRVGTKASSEASQLLSALFARVQEVRARLATGEVPDLEEALPPPAECPRPPLALPPGRIAGDEWQVENGKWKMENEGMKHQEVTPQPNPRLVPDSPSR